MRNFSLNSTEKAFYEKLTSLIPDCSGRFTIAFSGGCDSLALLVLCVRTLGPQHVVPVYVNHNIRSSAELGKEIELNAGNCRKLGLYLKVVELAPGRVASISSSRGGGTEDAARFLRYEALENERLQNGCSFILTAHHMQDQIETVVMRLQNGSPARSLRGIMDIDTRRHIARPLLSFSRMELEQYLKDLGFEWSTDSTNSMSCYRRNAIRNDLIPRLQAIWPDYEATLLGLSQSAAALGSCACPDGPGEGSLKGLREGRLGLSSFEGLDTSARTSLLYGMWDSLFPSTDMPGTLVSRVLSAISEARTATVASNGGTFSVYNGYLYLTDPSLDSIYSSFEVPFDPCKDQEIDLADGAVLLSGSNAEDLADPVLSLRMEARRFAGQAVLRYARPGDRIYLKGGAKMVMKLLQDMKIPSVLRRRVPVISDSEGICAVFCSVYGGNDRICVKFRSSLAPNAFPLYIVTEG